MLLIEGFASLAYRSRNPSLIFSTHHQVPSLCYRCIVAKCLPHSTYCWPPATKTQDLIVLMAFAGWLLQLVVGGRWSHVFIETCSRQSLDISYWGWDGCPFVFCVIESHMFFDHLNGRLGWRGLQATMTICVQIGKDNHCRALFFS